MPARVVGLIRLLDPVAFEEYRVQVGATVEHYQGRILFRGAHRATFWNDLSCAAFDAFVEIEFPDELRLRAWAGSPEYARLLPVRERAMQLTLFAVS